MMVLRHVVVSIGPPRRFDIWEPKARPQLGQLTCRQEKELRGPGLPSQRWVLAFNHPGSFHLYLDKDARSEILDRVLTAF